MGRLQRRYGGKRRSGWNRLIDPFIFWLLSNFGFEHGQPVAEVPPRWVREDGMFDTGRYERWKDKKYTEYLMITSSEKEI